MPICAGVLPAGKRVTGQVRLQDLPGTLLAAAGVPHTGFGMLNEIWRRLLGKNAMAAIRANLDRRHIETLRSLGYVQ